MGLRVELFAAIRGDARVEGLSIREFARRHGVHRRTVRQALASATPPPRKPRVGVSYRVGAVQAVHRGDAGRGHDSSEEAAAHGPPDPCPPGVRRQPQHQPRHHPSARLRRLGLLSDTLDEYICHQQIVAVRYPNKAAWNLDEWRPNVSYLQTVNARCNPGGSVIWD